MTAKVRVLLVDDSPLVLNILSRFINADTRLEVVATATSGQRALELIDQLQPDVICTDVQMPGMNGLDLIRQVMAKRPIPILVVSISVQQDQKENIFRLLEAGAVDVFPKPRASVRLSESEAKAFCDRVLVVSRVHVFRARASKPPPAVAPDYALKAPAPGRFDVVLIGGSTGAPQVFHRLFSQLGSGFCLPIVAVQHISEGFTASFVDWLNRSTQNRVKIAEQGEPLRCGTIYFPPDGAHVGVSNGHLRLDYDAPTNCGSRPSVNVMFESFVDAGRARRTLAILLSGMGRDGADGMAALHRNGAYTLAQSEESCAIFGMPKEAISLNAVDQVLNPEGISKLLNELC